MSFGRGNLIKFMVNINYNENVSKVVHKEVKMYCEIYLDSLFILQFIMNIFMLSLVNCLLKQKIRKRRLVFGALLGAVCSVLSMVLPFDISVRMGCSFCLSIICMIIVTFQISNISSFTYIMKRVGISTLLLGSLSLIIIRIIPKGDNAVLGISMVLAAVGIAFGLLKRGLLGQMKIVKNCKVILYGKEKLEINALVDTGNGLKEPISGKPVSILDKNIFEQLYDKEQQTYRVIPYHSVGRKNGVMDGYLIDRIVVETQEGKQEYKDVYVGICEDAFTQKCMYKMILHPGLME